MLIKANVPSDAVDTQTAAAVVPATDYCVANTPTLIVKYNLYSPYYKQIHINPLPLEMDI